MLVAFIVSLGLALITLAAISLQKTYSQLPAKEIKRRAQRGDELARVMFRVTTYGLSLVMFLWLVVGVSVTALFFVMVRWLPAHVAVLGILIVIWFGFVWVPHSRVTGLGLKVMRLLTPPLAWLLHYAHPILSRVGGFMRRGAVSLGHTKLYQREDLVELLQRQKTQTDNRMTTAELDIATHALSFGDRLVRDIFTPRSQVVSVRASDTIGPLLLDELHKSGHSRFPVYQDTPDAIVGVLHLRDLVQKQHVGTVGQASHRTVVYIHEDQTLLEALQAFLKTKQHLFIVVNSFEEIVGIVTIEDVLEQIIGKPIIDEFDNYEDLRAVATRQAAKIHKAQNH